MSSAADPASECPPHEAPKSDVRAHPLRRSHHLSPLLYKHVHSKHHEYHAPFQWVTQHEHVLELLPVSIWSVLVPIGLRCHPLTQRSGQP